jgi:hypothetical protein
VPKPIAAPVTTRQFARHSAMSAALSGVVIGRFRRCGVATALVLW